jgi:hypothetical protein
MTNDADYELWAAMMGEDEPVAPVSPQVPVVVASEPEVTIYEPAPPIMTGTTFEPVIVPEPVQIEPVQIEPVEIEPVQIEPVQFGPLDEDTTGFSDLAKRNLAELPSRVAEFVPAVEDHNSDDELDFPTNLFKEPQTNSITVVQVPDALTGEIVTESGEVLKTGAIDIPLMSNTGSIPIITDTVETIDEQAISADMGNETTGGIPPIRAKSVMNSSARVGVLPIKNRRSEGQTVLLATTSILLVTMGAAVLALYMLEIIK